MNYLYQIYYSGKRIVAEIMPPIVKLVGFIIVILILGSASKSAFEVTTLDKVKMGYCNEDEGMVGGTIIDLLTTEDSIKEIATFEKIDSIEEAEKMVSADELDAYIFIPSDFSKKAEENSETSNLSVYSKKYTGIKAITIQNVINSVLNSINAVSVITNQGGNVATLDQSKIGPSVESISLNKKQTTSSMQYFSIAMLLMMILYGAQYGCVGISEDFGALGDRIKVSPIRASETYVGKMVGFTMITFLSSIILMLFCHFGYDVDWGDNWPVLLLIVLAYSFLATVLGAFLCILIQNENRANTIVMAVIVAFTFLSGGFVVMDFGPLEKISPSYYAKTAINGLIYDSDMSVVYQNIGIIIAITAVLTVLSVLLARRKRG